jgi:flavin-binding protein dodecin
MADPVYQKVQLVGTSTVSFSDAVAVAIAKAAETMQHAAWFEVVEQRGNIANGKVQQYQVTLLVGYRVE